MSTTGSESHNWNSGSVTKQPNCIATGVKTYTCRTCGATKTESIAAKGHTPGAAATCTTPQKCTVCGTQLASPTDHKFDNGIISKEPTCLDDGVKTYTCSLCGETKTEPIISGNVTPRAQQQPAQPLRNAQSAELSLQRLWVIITPEATITALTRTRNIRSAHAATPKRKPAALKRLTAAAYAIRPSPSPTTPTAAQASRLLRLKQTARH